MNLKKMKGSYDAVISLGTYCQTAYQLKRKKLRGSSTPLDWMISPSLKDINCLLRNQFRDFMEYKNLKISDVANQYTHLIIDELYHIESHHDFPIAEQSQDPLYFYPIFKKKLDSKIDNFNKLLLCSKKILFVRMVATHDEIVELNTILQQLTNSDFFILVINFSNIVEIGSYKGKSTIALALGSLQISSKKRPIYAIDPFVVPPFRYFKENIEKHGLENMIIPIKKHSEEACDDIPDTIAAIFIDGNHDYNHVRQDIINYSPKVVQGGILLFHDYSDYFPGVCQAVEEHCNNSSFEYIALYDSLLIVRKIM